jgi:hypothetical protein
LREIEDGEEMKSDFEKITSSFKKSFCLAITDKTQLTKMYGLQKLETTPNIIPILKFSNAIDIIKSIIKQQIDEDVEIVN